MIKKKLCWQETVFEKGLMYSVPAYLSWKGCESLMNNLTGIYNLHQLMLFDSSSNGFAVNFSHKLDISCCFNSSDCFMYWDYLM